MSRQRVLFTPQTRLKLPKDDKIWKNNTAHDTLHDPLRCQHLLKTPSLDTTEVVRMWNEFENRRQENSVVVFRGNLMKNLISLFRDKSSACGRCGRKSLTELALTMLVIYLVKSSCAQLVKKFGWIPCYWELKRTQSSLPFGKFKE